MQHNGGEVQEIETINQTIEAINIKQRKVETVEGEDLQGKRKIMPGEIDRAVGRDNKGEGIGEGAGERVPNDKSLKRKRDY